MNNYLGSLLFLVAYSNAGFISENKSENKIVNDTDKPSKVMIVIDNRTGDKFITVKRGLASVSVYPKEKKEIELLKDCNNCYLPMHLAKESHTRSLEYIVSLKSPCKQVAAIILNAAKMQEEGSNYLSIMRVLLAKL